MKPILYTHADTDRHRIHAGHPECPERRQAVMNHLKKTGALEGWEIREPRPASRVALERVHTAGYVDHVFGSSPDSGIVDLDPETSMVPGSLRAALLAAGAMEDAAARVVRGETRRVFSVLRPPGHHAERDAAMGFCIFNNIAVGAAAALAEEGIERVAVLDFDVHHGNGTVEIFRDRPGVLVCSSFQHPLYPNRYQDLKLKHIVNTPLAAGTDGKRFRAAIERDWLPAVRAWRPQVIFVSAGFDAHEDDPLAQLRLVDDDFGWITERIVEMAAEHAEGRIVSALEGGYHLEALARSAAVHAEILARGED